MLTTDKLHVRRKKSVNTMPHVGSVFPSKEQVRYHESVGALFALDVGFKGHKPSRLR